MCKYEVTVSELSNHKSLHSQKAPYIPVCLKALESRLQDQEREAAWNLGLRDLRCKKNANLVLGLALRGLSGFCFNMFQQFEDQNPKYHKLIQSASSLTITWSCDWPGIELCPLTQGQQAAWSVRFPNLKDCGNDWSWYWNSRYRSQDLYGLTICVIVLSDEVRRCLQQKSWSRLQMSQNCFKLDLRSYRSKEQKPQA